ncbi:hypothetical protein PHLCEN_2v11134 [Hermanssonia centrifuga]|uniref:Uncharacterized protein n=1 Tax=Hermanssonia centrifuga TaxID=98765 RepID=A0A2R6NKW7_9APHY|nr:hypothetical protein PHLCEN_2v11134 [Hermanssonia centrifuga]
MVIGRFKPWNDRYRTKNKGDPGRKEHELPNLWGARRYFYVASQRKHNAKHKDRHRPHDRSENCLSKSQCNCSRDDAYTDDSSPSFPPKFVIKPPKGWDVRRRDSRVNGADIYVARVVKNGMGDARPCWRCIEWCRWAGIKRVFHWNGQEGKFEVVKVNDADCEPYETPADTRRFAGQVRCFSPSRNPFRSPKSATSLSRSTFPPFYFMLDHVCL